MNEKIYGCVSMQVCKSSQHSQRNCQNGIKNRLFSPNLSLNLRPVLYCRYQRYRKKATLTMSTFQHNHVNPVTKPHQHTTLSNEPRNRANCSAQKLNTKVPFKTTTTPKFYAGQRPSSILRFSMQSDGRRPLMEDDLLWKTTFDGRQPLIEEDL